MNKRGIALILSYMVIAVLTAFGSIFVTRGVSESNIARRYADSVRAFWIAEAGLADGYSKYQAGPDNWDVDIGGGACSVEIVDIIDPDDPPARREIRASATYGSGQRIVMGFLLYIPHPFFNTISAGGDLSLSGLLARVEVYDKTRISGTYSESFGASGWFEDKEEGVDPSTTTIEIPDNNGNGTADEFGDFVLFGQEVVSTYPAEEVVYIQTDDTVNIFPSSELVGKKIVFVEGSSPGTGDVNIFFDSTWSEGEDLTVISTGEIAYIQPLQFQEDARLSTVSWGDYEEISIFRSEHESIIYTHEDAEFVDILDWGSTTGNIISNNDISLQEVLTYEKFYFSDRAMNGDLAPGFEFLSSVDDFLLPSLTSWQEE